MKDKVVDQENYIILQQSVKWKWVALSGHKVVRSWILSKEHNGTLQFQTHLSVLIFVWLI